jgi:RHS repeat-associated protein
MPNPCHCLLAQQDASNNWEHPLTDGLGSVRGVLDSSAAPLESRHYSPYGEPISATGANQTPFGFTGEPTDGNGLVYLRARYYNPSLGVFPSLDPLEGRFGSPLSLNRYIYVKQNPINDTDPSGLVNRSDIQSGRTVYSCNCGWLDWHHADPINGVNVISSVKHARDAQYYANSNCGGMYFDISINAWSKNLYNFGAGKPKSFYVPKNSTMDVYLQAGIIYTEMVATLEIYESKYGPFAGDSGLSVEDLPSYFLGYLFAVQIDIDGATQTYYNLGDSGKANLYGQLKTAIAQDCDIKDTQTSLDVFDKHEGSHYREKNKSLVPADRDPNLNAVGICTGPTDYTRIPNFWINANNLFADTYSQVGTMQKERPQDGTCKVAQNIPYPNNVVESIPLYLCETC